MFDFGSASVEFLPDPDARAWVADGLRALLPRLGPPALEPRLVGSASGAPPGSLDDLFDLMCGIQGEVGQSEVEFTMVEMVPEDPQVPPGFVPLGDAQGQMMHTFVNQAGEYLVVTVPAIFRLEPIVYSSVARELGRIAIHRGGGEPGEPEEIEADAELAAVALGMGVWVANGAYVFENACCGGGCGIDLTTLRAGLSMPEACFALALDGHRKGLSRRTVARGLDGTQKAALKRSWSFVGKQPELKALASGGSPALGEA